MRMHLSCDFRRFIGHCSAAGDILLPVDEFRAIFKKGGIEVKGWGRVYSLGYVDGYNMFASWSGGYYDSQWLET